MNLPAFIIAIDQQIRILSNNELCGMNDMPDILDISGEWEGGATPREVAYEILRINGFFDFSFNKDSDFEIMDIITGRNKE